MEAAKNSHFNVVAFLLGCEWVVTNPRVEVDLVDASQQALVQAAGQGVDEVVEYLLDVAEVTVDGQDSLSGETPLTLASSNGHRSTVILLLDRGAQVSSTNMKVSLLVFTISIKLNQLKLPIDFCVFNITVNCILLIPCYANLAVYECSGTSCSRWPMGSG